MATALSDALSTHCITTLTRLSAHHQVQAFRPLHAVPISRADAQGRGRASAWTVLRMVKGAHTADPDVMVPRLRGLRVFAGYAGWGQGQLDGEIDRGDWVVVPALPDDVLAPAGIDLWSRTLRRQGLPLALLATYPTDPSEN